MAIVFPVTCTLRIFFECFCTTFGFFPDIEVFYHRLAVDGDVELAPAGTVCFGAAGAEPGFDEIELDTVVAGCYREGVDKFLETIAECLEERAVDGVLYRVGDGSLAGEERGNSFVIVGPGGGAPGGSRCYRVAGADETSIVGVGEPDVFFVVGVGLTAAVDTVEIVIAFCFRYRFLIAGEDVRYRAADLLAQALQFADDLCRDDLTEGAGV